MHRQVGPNTLNSSGTTADLYENSISATTTVRWSNREGSEAISIDLRERLHSDSM